MVLAKAAADGADRTHALVRALNSAVVRMGCVVGLICSIAGPTNLPARSAMIVTAARAAAAGRGVAVLALAGKTWAGQTKAAAEISGDRGDLGPPRRSRNQVGQVRASTGHAVSAIRPDPAALGEFYKSSPTVLPPSRAPRRS